MILIRESETFPAFNTFARRRVLLRKDGETYCVQCYAMDNDYRYSKTYHRNLTEAWIEFDSRVMAISVEYLQDYKEKNE